MMMIEEEDKRKMTEERKRIKGKLGLEREGMDTGKQKRERIS